MSCINQYFFICSAVVVLGKNWAIFINVAWVSLPPGRLPILTLFTVKLVDKEFGKSLTIVLALLVEPSPGAPVDSAQDFDISAQDLEDFVPNIPGVRDDSANYKLLKTKILKI